MKTSIKKSVLLLFTIFCLFFTACIGEQVQPIEQPVSAPLAQSTLEVHFLDVGQADATLIRLPGGSNVLIDGGNREDKDYILYYLAAYGIEQLDLIVATHPHEDHIGALRDVIGAVPAAKILLPTVDADTLVYTNLLYAIEENEVEEERILGQSIFELDGVQFEILGPLKEYGSKNSGAVNNASIVIRMIHGDNAFLFTGDMEKEAEEDLLAAGNELKSQVLKVAHHGSKTSNTEDFLKAVSPALAVIHVGENNKYGLPDDSVIERLAAMNVAVYRTDMNKEIIVISDGTALQVETGFTGLDEFTLEDTGEEQTENTSKTEEDNKTEDLKEFPPPGPEPEQEEVDSGQSLENDITADTETAPEGADSQSPPAGEGKYIGNLNSKIYHEHTCGNLPAEKNSVYFASAKEAEEAGYTGHKTCVK